MKRRRVLGAAVALAATGAWARPVFAAASPHVVVVGAGIMGASIAFNLAKRGARVTLLEKASPGAGSTHAAFAWLISSPEVVASGAYINFYKSAVGAWRVLAQELAGALAVQWGGAVDWFTAGTDLGEIRARLQAAQAAGSPIRAVTKEEMANLVPGVVLGDFIFGTFRPDSGTVDPQAAVDAFVSAAQKRGAILRTGCEVRGFATRDRRVNVVETSAGPIAADFVVLAGGVSNARLAESVGVKIPLNVLSGALAHSKPYRRVIQRVLNTPGGSLKQNPDGRIVTGPSYAPGAQADDGSEAYGKRLLAQAASVVPAAAGAELEYMTLGQVPIPTDNQPIVGFCKQPANAYVALTMSGITTAPMVGAYAAREILDSMAVEALADYRPDRFGT